MAFSQASQTPLPKAERLRWFQDAKLGIFVHWGVYASVGKSEWARDVFHIPQPQYDEFAHSFNPSAFDANAWLDLVASSGARYMVVTSKHHDGFSIYRSPASDYDMEITPYPGDPLKMLSTAAKARNIRLGFYYSIMDWHHPDYFPKRDWEVKASTPQANGSKNIDKYIEFAKAQLKELLTGYGDVASMWFDGEWEHTNEEVHATEIREMIRSLQPNALVNDRLFKRQPGADTDFGTPEQYVPATGIRTATGKPLLWESCVTVNQGSWGYSKYETDFKTPRDLIRMLIEVVSKGGNLLLNVGPRPDGTISEDFTSRLRTLGRWLEANGDSIYGTTASPFERLPFFGRATRKGNRIFLHVFEWPKNQKLVVPGLRASVASAYLLSNPNSKFNTSQRGHDLLIDVPASAPDETANVIVIEMSSKPVIEQSVDQPDSKGVVHLRAETAEIESNMGQRAQKDNFLGHVFITKWTRSEDVPSWKFRTLKTGSYAINMSYGAGKASQGGTFSIEIDQQKLDGKVETTSNPFVFGSHELATVQLKPGNHTIRIRSNIKHGDEVMTLESVDLTPATTAKS